ncbi:MAG: hypothetical protein PHU25_09040 [Deltaproteobacteria bacterium]|nr:hypothetical protein [Deltaproteobacteria bacterium]
MQQPQKLSPEPPPDHSVDVSGDASGAISRTPRMIVLGLLAVGVAFFGFNMGNAWSDRVQLNESLRDCLIVQFEVERAAKLFDELDAVINAAILRAGKHQYDPRHIEFLANNVKENPIHPQLFTERSYRSFGRPVVLNLSAYLVKWSALYRMTALHRQKTLADEAALKTFKGKFEKIFMGSYGVAFARDKKEGNKLVGNVAYLGPVEQKGEKSIYPVKAAPDAAGEKRELYNPSEEGDDGVLSKSPGDYVVEIAPEAKSGLLAGAVRPQFDAYIRRLDEMATQMKTMRDEQTGLMRKLAELASQDPAALASPDPEAEFEDYASQNQRGSAGAAPAAK